MRPNSRKPPETSHGYPVRKVAEHAIRQCMKRLEIHDRRVAISRIFHIAKYGKDWSTPNGPAIWLNEDVIGYEPGPAGFEGGVDIVTFYKLKPYAIGAMVERELKTITGNRKPGKKKAEFRRRMLEKQKKKKEREWQC